jgi:hypothetical protein
MFDCPPIKTTSIGVKAIEVEEEAEDEELTVVPQAKSEVLISKVNNKAFFLFIL